MNNFHCVYHSVSSALIDFCFDVYICEGVYDLPLREGEGGGEREGRVLNLVWYPCSSREREGEGGEGGRFCLLLSLQTAIEDLHMYVAVDNWLLDNWLLRWGQKH